jgi:kynurenine formamidase
VSLAGRTPPTVEEYQAYKKRLSNWGRWGDEDQLGTLNHITSEVRLSAAALVGDGTTVSLANPIATAGVLPGPRNPSPADHRMNVSGGGSGDYIGVSYHGFANSHIDALCHIFAEGGRLYNDRPAADVGEDGAKSNAIDAWRDGIVTRGVLYDVPRYRGEPHVTLERPVHGWEMDDVASAQGIEPRPGDAVLVRAGAEAFWSANPDFEPPWRAPGLHASVLEFLYERDVALLGWDLMEAPGQEAYGAPSLPIHSLAIPYMGLPLLDNLNLERIADACARAGRWEFMLVIAPLVVIGGTGSPVNPIAIL